jgi:hypothetical protein
MENKLGSEAVALVGVIDPVSEGVGSTSTIYVDMALFDQLMAVISAGTLGAAATLDAKLEQAKDVGGTDVKDITDKSITQLVKATNDDDQAIINVRAEELDVAGGFSFVRLTLTVAAAASLVYGELLGIGPRYGPASDNDLASVQEIVA